MYRYRDSSGSTFRSLGKFDQHIHKVGVVHEIRGYVYQSRLCVRTAVLIKGDKGSARFNGFSWGYGGEGPRGLRTILTKLNVSSEEIERILQTKWETNNPMKSWVIRL